MTAQHPLGRLIEETRTANGWSLDDVVARARRRGHQISPQNISRIKNEPVVTVKAATLRALADGLSLPVPVVLNAAVTSMGFRTDAATSSAEEAIRNDHQLSERDRRLLLALLAELRKDEEVTGNAEHPAPKYGAGTPPAQDQTREAPRASLLMPTRPLPAGSSITFTRTTDGRWVEDVSEPAPPASRGADDEAAPAEASGTPSKLERLRKLQHEAHPLPTGIAARNVGQPSRGQQIRERQDDAGERPDVERGDR